MIVAELSDEQVRRLLIEELRKQTKDALSALIEGMRNADDLAA